ncbi:MAG: FG-GAP-like repeat-containing protein [Actinomycetota bacterium]|nr:FG-GAP-like repeat-containing protein [Actinomycetota bacterium]
MIGDLPVSSSRSLYVVVGGNASAAEHCGNRWSLHSAAATAGTDTTFTLGTTPLVPLTGDWDGNGSKSPGYFKGGVFYLSNSTGATPTVDQQFPFGDSRGFPVAGDFNGDGTDDVAVYRDGQWQLRFSTGTVQRAFRFGPGGSWPNTVPVAGDWDGDGIDGIGTYTYATGTWNLNQTADASPVDIGPFVYWAGSATSSYPVVGDGNGDGIDSVGVRSTGASWSLNDQNDASGAEQAFVYGNPSALPLTWRPVPSNP